MKRLFFICLFLCFLASKCTDKENILPCSDCYDREAVLKVVNKMAEKRLKDKIDEYQIEIEEQEDFYTIIYTNIELIKDPLMQGGSTYIVISKKDCKIIKYIITK